jgi:hypothetical protein
MSLITYLTRIHFADRVLEDALPGEVARLGLRSLLIVHDKAAGRATRSTGSCAPCLPIAPPHPMTLPPNAIRPPPPRSPARAAATALPVSAAMWRSTRPQSARCGRRPARAGGADHDGLRRHLAAPARPARAAIAPACRRRPVRSDPDPAPRPRRNRRRRHGRARPLPGDLSRHRLEPARRRHRAGRGAPCRPVAGPRRRGRSATSRPGASCSPWRSTAPWPARRGWARCMRCPMRWSTSWPPPRRPPHGTLHAALLAPVLRFNAPAVGDRFGALAEALALPPARPARRAGRTRRPDRPARPPARAGAGTRIVRPHRRQGGRGGRQPDQSAPRHRRRLPQASGGGMVRRAGKCPCRDLLARQRKRDKVTSKHRKDAREENYEFSRCRISRRVRSSVPLLA